MQVDSNECLPILISQLWFELGYLKFIFFSQSVLVFLASSKLTNKQPSLSIKTVQPHLIPFQSTNWNIKFKKNLNPPHTFELILWKKEDEIEKLVIHVFARIIGISLSIGRSGEGRERGQGYGGGGVGIGGKTKPGRGRMMNVALHRFGNRFLRGVYASVGKWLGRAPAAGNWRTHPRSLEPIPIT